MKTKEMLTNHGKNDYTWTVGKFIVAKRARSSFSFFFSFRPLLSSSFVVLPLEHTSRSKWLEEPTLHRHDDAHANRDPHNTEFFTSNPVTNGEQRLLRGIPAQRPGNAREHNGRPLNVFLNVTKKEGGTNIKSRLHPLSLCEFLWRLITARLRSGSKIILPPLESSRVE